MDVTQTAGLEAELRAVEAELAQVEAAIKRNTGSDRDRAALKALCAQSEELGRKRYLLKKQLRAAVR